MLIETQNRSEHANDAVQTETETLHLGYDTRLDAAMASEFPVIAIVGLNFAPGCAFPFSEAPPCSADANQQFAAPAPPHCLRVIDTILLPALVARVPPQAQLLSQQPVHTHLLGQAARLTLPTLRS